MNYELDSADLVSSRSALEELAKNHPQYPSYVAELHQKLSEGVELNIYDRRYLVLALHVYSVRNGFIAMNGAIGVARKVGIEADLRISLRDWVHYLKVAYEAEEHAPTG